MDISIETLNAVAKNLKDFNSSFKVTINPTERRITATITEISFPPAQLKRLIDIVNGYSLSIKRSGAKISLTIY